MEGGVARLVARAGSRARLRHDQLAARIRQGVAWSSRGISLGERAGKTHGGVKPHLGGYFTHNATPNASDLEKYAHAQGWTKTQTPNGPPKYIDENDVPRMTLKEGSLRAPGSAHPHGELKDANGQRIDPHGNLNP